MPRSNSKSPPAAPAPGAGAGAGKDKKVYRSMAEIRRAFYPKAGDEKSKAHQRASHDLLATRRSGQGGAL